MTYTYRITAIVAIILALPCCSRWRDAVVATVDSEKITTSELRTEMNMERGKYDPAVLHQPENFNEFKNQAIEKLTQEEILLAEAKRLGIKASPEELKEIKKMREGVIDQSPGEQNVDSNAWIESQRRRLVIQKLIRQEVIEKIPVSDEAVAEYYRQHTQSFNRPSQFHARQIIVDSRELADEVLAKIKQGEDFGELAKKYSISPDGKRGGDLGYFDANTYPEQFTEICQQLKTGEISDVIPTDYGFQLFQLIDRRAPHQLSLAEASDKIRQRLKEESAETAVKQWSEQIMSNAKVAINEEVLKEVSLEK